MRQASQRATTSKKDYNEDPLEVALMFEDWGIQTVTSR